MISSLSTPQHQSNENKGKVIISKGQIYPAYKWLNIELHQNNLLVSEWKMLNLAEKFSKADRKLRKFILAWKSHAI